MPAVTAKSPVLNDIARMWNAAREQGVAEEIRRMHRPSMPRTVTAAVCDWLMILGAFAAFLVWGPVISPLAIIIMGNRQRALGNLLHDAAHGSLGADRAVSDQVAQWLLFRPMWVSLWIYRREHFAHHRRLGSAGDDVDLIHSEADMHLSWRALLCGHLMRRETWLGSAFGQLPRLGTRELGLVLAWWGTLLLAIALVVTPGASLAFMLLWLGARASVFHFITTFREISDHVGLMPGTLLGFSRNQTAGGLLGALFHPHNNGYHLVHHLNPAMPYFALPRAHALLQRTWPEYAAAAHCQHYFSGETPLVRSWVRAAQSGDRGARPLPVPGREQRNQCPTVDLAV
jgi:fatty acid desaturase